METSSPISPIMPALQQKYQREGDTDGKNELFRCPVCRSWESFAHLVVDRELSALISDRFATEDAERHAEVADMRQSPSTKKQSMDPYTRRELWKEENEILRQRLNRLTNDSSSIEKIESFSRLVS